jgi:hypothetical protein
LGFSRQQDGPIFYGQHCRHAWRMKIRAIPREA